VGFSNVNSIGLLIDHDLLSSALIGDMLNLNDARRMDSQTAIFLRNFSDFCHVGRHFLLCPFCHREEMHMNVQMRQSDQA
jgi:hypothetical protein